MLGAILYSTMGQVIEVAVAHFDWTVAMMAFGLVISVLAALYIGSEGVLSNMPITDYATLGILIGTLMLCAALAFRSADFE